MTFASFTASLDEDQPPAGCSLALLGLWHDGRGNWDSGHECAQNQDDSDGAWVHAYLHRKEGDLANASYWYRKAGQPPADSPFEIEWESIARTLVTRTK